MNGWILLPDLGRFAQKFVALFVVAKDQSLIRNISSEQNSSKLMAEKEIDFLQKPTELNGLSVIWLIMKLWWDSIWNTNDWDYLFKMP